MAVDSANNILVTGFFEDTINFRADFEDPDDVRNSRGENDLFVTKIHPDGAYGWTRQIGGPAWDVGYGITTNQQDDVHVTGFFSDAVNFGEDFGTSDVKTSKGTRDVFVTNIIVE